jgi:hypothetical protein
VIGAAPEADGQARVISQFSTAYPQAYKADIHRIFSPSGRLPAGLGSAEQPAVVAEDHAGGVMAGGAGDAAAGMGAASAVVEAF